MRKSLIAFLLIAVFVLSAIASLANSKQKATTTTKAATATKAKDATTATAATTETAATTVTAAAPAMDEIKPAVTNKECPVSGGKVNPQYRTEYNGQYVYVCCQGCLDEFKKDPEKFVAKMSKEDREAIKTNALCPMSKEPVKKEFRVEDNGKLVYFCCAGCMESYKKKMAARATMTKTTR